MPAIVIRPGVSDSRTLGFVEPTTGYALLGEQRIAYQVLGEGQPDLVLTPSWFSAFDIEWEQPDMRRFFLRMAALARIVRFDRRGSGASDPLPPGVLPAWEYFSEDIECVMDTVGSEKAILWADGDAGPLGLLFAATRPDRVSGLVLFNTSARFLVDDDYPIGFGREMFDEIGQLFQDDWGTGEQLSLYMPSRADDLEFQRWTGRLMRAVTTPSSVRSYMEGVITADARDALSSIEVPTLILHSPESQVPPIDHARYLHEKIVGSKLVVLEGPGDAYPAFALADEVIGAFQEFVTGAPAPVPAERILATVLFTDIVESTRRAREIGDRKWRQMLDLHDETVEGNIARHSGRLVKNTGDGILATFEGPGRAVGFASALRTELERLGLSIRTGIHTGEVELRSSDIGGLAVHLAARIMATAKPDEILVSRTVKDLVIGSPIAFQDRGVHRLKGIEGEWQLFAVAA